MSRGAVPPAEPEWLQELPVLNAEAPEEGLYVALGTFEGVLNPIFRIGNVYGSPSLGFIGPYASHVWHLNEKWRFEPAYTAVLVTVRGSTKLIDDYNIQGLTPRARLEFASTPTTEDIYGKLLLNE